MEQIAAEQHLAWMYRNYHREGVDRSLFVDFWRLGEDDKNTNFLLARTAIDVYLENVGIKN